MKMPSLDSFVNRLDPFVKPLVICFLIETHLKTENSLQGPLFFLWLERSIAVLFTIEWAIRFHRNLDGYRRSVWNFIDLIAIVPFWIGFTISWWWPQHLHLIRTLRIFRLLKFFRYSRSLQLVALGFYRAWPQVKSLLFSMMIVGLFSMVAMHEAERKAQPEEFDSLFDSLWFTAVTAKTVGYGDISPVTVVGKCVAMVTFVFALSLFAAIVGVLGSSFSKVIEEEMDPNVDPIQKFREAFKQHAKAAKADKEYEGAGQ